MELIAPGGGALPITRGRQAKTNGPCAKELKEVSYINSKEGPV